MFKLVLEKAEETKIKLPTSAGSSKKQESSRKTSISSLLTSQSFWLCSVQFSSVTQSCPTLCYPMNRSPPASLSITSSQSLPKLMSIESVMPSNQLILCCALLILCCAFLLLPSIFLSIRVFSNESVVHIKWPKYWSFSLSISPSNKYSGLISFRMDWLDLLAVQGTLKSFLQHHSSKASILWCSAFFVVQLSHLYLTTGKTIALTPWTMDLGSKWCLCFLIRCVGLSWMVISP